MNGLGVGRIVHYRTAVATENGDDGIRPAIITKVWSQDGMVNLVVFYDGSYDNPAYAGDATAKEYRLCENEP